MLSNLDSICSTINTSLSLGDRLSRSRNGMKNKSDCSAYPEGNYSPTVGKGAPPYLRSDMGLTMWPMLELKRREKEQAVDVPLTLLNLRPPEMHKTPK